MSGIQFIRANPAVAGAESMTATLNRAEDRSRARGVDDAIRRGVMRGQKERMAGGVTSADRDSYAEGESEGIGSIFASGASMGQPAPMPAPVAEPMVSEGDDPSPTVLSDRTIPMAFEDMQPAGYSTASPARPTRGEVDPEAAPAVRGRMQRAALNPADEDYPQQIMAINDGVVAATPALGGGGRMQQVSNTAPPALRTSAPPAISPPRDAPRGTDAPMPAGAREGASAITPVSAGGGQRGGARRTSDLVLEELAQTPGGGAAALGLVREQGRQDTVTGRQDAQSRERAERMALQALGRGDITTFNHFAGQARINLPPEVVQNAEMRARIATAGLLAQRHYRGDAAGARRFVEAYVRSGDAAAALQQAGAPSTAGTTGFRPMWVQQDEQEILQFFNTRNPAAPAVPAQSPTGQPVTRPAQGGRLTTDGDGNRVQVDRGGVARPVTTPGGAPVAAPPSRAAAGRTLDRTARRDMLMAGGLSEQEANMIAGGGVPSPSARATIQQRLIVAAENNLDLTTPQQKADWVQRQMGAIFPPGAAPAPAAPAQALPPAATDPGSAAPPPRAAPPAAAAPSGLPRVTTRQEYDALPEGARYIDPNGRERTKVPRA
jgi:hypothetical protein